MTTLGIAGLGRWGRILVDSLQQEGEDLRFLAACTGRPERAADYAARAGLALEPDYEALLARPDLDGVVLATPHRRHGEQIRQALLAGKHVLVEKPMVLRAEEAAALLALAEERGLVLTVGFNRRFSPALRRLKTLLDEGELGRPLAFEGHFSAPGGYRYQSGMWRADPDESPVGGMTGLGVHLLDCFLHLGGPIATVETRARSDLLPVPLDDTVMVALDFAGGALGNLTTVIATPALWSLRVMGSKAWAEMRGYDRLLVTALDGTGREEILAPPAMERDQLRAFAAAIRGEAPAAVPPADALHGVAVFEAICRSRESGRREAVQIT